MWCVKYNLYPSNFIWHTLLVTPNVRLVSLTSWRIVENVIFENFGWSCRFSLFHHIPTGPWIEVWWLWTVVDYGEPILYGSMGVLQCAGWSKDICKVTASYVLILHNLTQEAFSYWYLLQLQRDLLSYSQSSLEFWSLVSTVHLYHFYILDAWMGWVTAAWLAD